jgi:hypothetical protein
MGALISKMVTPELSKLVPTWSRSSATPRLPDPRLRSPRCETAAQATPGLRSAIARRFWRKYTPEQLVRMSLQTIVHKPSRVPMPIVEA